MKSKRHPHFRKFFKKLPPQDQKLARDVYRLWRSLVDDPSKFDELARRIRWHRYASQNPPVFSVDITNKIRALCVKREDAYIWYYIGEHPEGNEKIPFPKKVR
jgi:hypothetical protein